VEVINQFAHSKDTYVYQLCRTRKIKGEDGKEIRILDLLIKEGTLIDKSITPRGWGTMSDEDLIHYVRSNYYGSNITEFQRSESQAYRQARTRRMQTEDGRKIRVLDFLVREGTLINRKETNPSITASAEKEVLENMLDEYSGGKK